jgi:hypothetical protein
MMPGRLIGGKGKKGTSAISVGGLELRAGRARRTRLAIPVAVNWVVRQGVDVRMKTLLRRLLGVEHAVVLGVGLVGSDLVVRARPTVRWSRSRGAVSAVPIPRG